MAPAAWEFTFLMPSYSLCIQFTGILEWQCLAQYVEKNLKNITIAIYDSSACCHTTRTSVTVMSRSHKLSQHTQPDKPLGLRHVWGRRFSFNHTIALISLINPTSLPVCRVYVSPPWTSGWRLCSASVSRSTRRSPVGFWTLLKRCSLASSAAFLQLNHREQQLHDLRHIKED